MPSANFNVDSYLPCGSRLKNEVNAFPSVSPPCLISLIAFEIRCIGRVLLVLGSRSKGSNLQGVTGTNEMQLSDRKLYLSDRPKISLFSDRIQLTVLDMDVKN